VWPRESCNENPRNLRFTTMVREKTSRSEAEVNKIPLSFSRAFAKPWLSSQAQ
jgi:hypothetical protein